MLAEAAVIWVLILPPWEAPIPLGRGRVLDLPNQEAPLHEWSRQNYFDTQAQCVGEQLDLIEALGKLDKDVVAVLYKKLSMRLLLAKCVPLRIIEESKK